MNDNWPKTVFAALFACLFNITLLWILYRIATHLCEKAQRELWANMSREEKESYWQLGGDYMKDEQ
jgi:hypothetical protein